MAFKIFPPIGIARVGNSQDSFFVGPEVPGSPGIEIADDGSETRLVSYKTDSTKIKRQGARFRIFDVDSGGNATPLVLATGDSIQWTVKLANKKSAVRRGLAPPSSASRPVIEDADKVIEPASKNVAGANAPPKSFNDSDFEGRSVPLGDVRTDKNQNLIVLGGFGFSSSPSNSPIGSFYTNPGWHDDTSDGKVTARIIRANGDIEEDIAAAWCIISTPDYAASINGIVTLHDILTQVAIDNLGLAIPDQPSFTKDIFPILVSASSLRFVNLFPDFADISTDWTSLSNSSDASRPAREEALELVGEGVEFLSRFSLTNFQVNYLEKWVDGDFLTDWTGVPLPGATITAEGLTRAALGGTVGQGFFPGIEAGRIVTDSTLYSSPFEYRFDSASIEPGDITALMAVPWQADFYECQGSWWPAQRPDSIFVSETNDTRAEWARGISGKRELVDKFPGLGFVVPVGGGEFPKMIEKDRADSDFFL